jgi:putative endonuclease
VLRWLYRIADRVRDTHRRKVWARDQATGRFGEDLALRFLQDKGFTIVARNYRMKGLPAEIDLIARDRDTLAFIEVKTKTRSDFGSPSRQVSRSKVKAMRRVARRYARRAGVPWDQVRLDLVSIVLQPRLEIEYQPRAFAASRRWRL